MKILSRYHESFSVEIDMPKARLIENILQNKGTTLGALGIRTNDPVDFNEISLITEDSIEIIVKYQAFNPDRGTGKIYMTLYEGKNATETRIKGEIVPYEKEYLSAAYTVLTFLPFWTLACFLFSVGIYNIALAALGWTIIPLTLYMTLISNKNKLREYRNFFLAAIVRNDWNRNEHQEEETPLIYQESYKLKEVPLPSLVTPALSYLP